MAISFGPKLGLLYNALIGESYFDSLRLFIQSIDALVQGSVINATQSAPPSSPSGGDAYLLTGGTPSGVWTGQAGKIAVWDAQLTNSGTNTVVPGWIFLTPKAGWTIWNVATASLTVYNGTSWVAVGGGGADFPINDDITNMTAIAPSSGNAGILVTSTLSTPAGVQLIGPSGGTAIGVHDGAGHSGGLTYDATLYSNGVNCSGTVLCGGIVSSGTNVIGNLLNGTPGSPITVNMAGATTPSANITFGGTGVIYQAMLGFGPGYITQTTVGAAGGASALPATPTGYLPILVGTTQFVIPYYAHS